ncbi:sulfotransferase [Vibrio sp. 10N.261.52.F3]|uniref:sulfotransferase family protein n=1 Tax=Vibrio sp. 10N.261.52.F3 TaxID=3229683 RepID=UPI00355145E8
MSRIFLSGMMRSGTTLLQRALDQHPKVSLSYQNKTRKILDLLKKFHGVKNLEKYHLLSHYSPNYDYSIQELTRWLDENVDINTLLSPGESGAIIGVKEVLAEELVPFFVNHGVKCINIVRDPRDVIASISFGNGIEHTGLERPVLFDIKNWRKSVLVSYLLKDSDFLLTIRMEDLIESPESTMLSIYKFLNVDCQSFSILVEKMNASTWKGNSSFGDKKVFDPSAIGNYKTVLSKDVVEYIETTCHEEMKYMKYQRDNANLNANVISSYSDSFVVNRKEFEPHYSSNSENVSYELNRSSLGIDELIEVEFLGFHR